MTAPAPFAAAHAILFACTLNSVRSPIAAALLRRRLTGRAFVDSCGLRPAAEIDPFAVVVLEERGLDVRAHQPKGFGDLHDDSFDLVVSLTPEAHHRAIEFSRNLATHVEFWPTADPTLETGSRSQRLDAYRQVRDALDARLTERFARASTFGG